MKKLVDDMLDLARGRLSGGLTIDPVQNYLIELTCAIDRPVPADHGRIAQLFSNLIGNAVTYGSDQHAIRIGASTRGDQFEFFVANAGEPISPEVLSRLFQPFYRGTTERDSGGLSLGLYIASQIARAHGGELIAISDQLETRVTFKMPLANATG